MDRALACDLVFRHPVVVQLPDLQALQRGVDLGRFDFPVGISANHGLERRTEFITVAGTLGKQTENGKTHRHN